jgi:hypothetical protein
MDPGTGAVEAKVEKGLGRGPSTRIRSEKVQKALETGFQVMIS